MNRRLLRSILALAVTALTLPVGSVHAQSIDTSTYAVLAVGPERGRGIDGIYPNVIPFWHSVYLVAEESIELFLVDGPIAGAEGWPISDCQLQTLRSPAPTFYYYADMGGWSVLFSVVPASDENHSALVCSFANRLIDRFLYFKRTAPEADPDRVPVPAMPAIVELN